MTETVPWNWTAMETMYENYSNTPVDRIRSINDDEMIPRNISYLEATTEQFAEFFYRYSNTLLSKPYKRVLLSLYIILIILGSGINLLLVYTIQRLRNPKSISNRRMLICRVLCDIGLVWLVIPYTAYTAVYRDWQLGSAMCKLSAFTIYFIVALNNFLLVAICLNRTVAISQSDKGPTDPTTNVPCRVKCLLCMAVLSALTIAFPGGLVSREVQHPMPPLIRAAINQYPMLQELQPRMCKETWNREAQLAYDVSLIITIYLTPLFVVCLSQHVVTVHLRRSQRLLVLVGHQNTLAWTRRRQRLTRLCVLMAALFVLSWSPNHIANLLVKTFHVNDEAAEILLDFSMWIAMSNTVTGPWLFIATCSVYHRFIKRLFTCRRSPHSGSGNHWTRPAARTNTSARSSISMLNMVGNINLLVPNQTGRVVNSPTTPKLEAVPHLIHSPVNEVELVDLG